MRPLHAIAYEIFDLWFPRHPMKCLTPGQVYARPYIQALANLESVEDRYGMDSADSIIRYALNNLRTFRGADARRLKAELKDHLKRSA